MSSPAAIAAPLDALCCAPERRWSCRVEDLRRGRHRVRLSGSLHAGWAGRLAAALAARDVSIVRVIAQRGDGGLWDAELEVEARDREAGLAGFDFLAVTLEHDDPQRLAGRAVLTSYAIRRTPADAVVELRAPDAVGFLDRILREFAFHGLFPHALRIETRGTEAQDLFRLATLAGRTPSAAVVSALEARLDSLLARGSRP